MKKFTKKITKKHEKIKETLGKKSKSEKWKKEKIGKMEKKSEKMVQIDYLYTIWYFLLLCKLEVAGTPTVFEHHQKSLFFYNIYQIQS